MGSGIQRMATVCLDAGLPSPDLEEIGTRFRVTLWTQCIHPSTLDAKDRAILALPSPGVPPGCTPQAQGTPASCTHQTRSGSPQPRGHGSPKPHRVNEVDPVHEGRRPGGRVTQGRPAFLFPA
ncbi:hypothetical protein FMEAI12_5000029 [Parafrankia sp. Ea1.12]|nr:hypothetical protein FMEAI12_5000029 [Parafrankia sp. Ea1.12]